MGKDKFESYIQSVFEDHEVSIDTNEIWEGVKPNLNKKSTGFPLWLLGLIGLLMVSSVGIYYLVGDTSSGKKGLNKIESNQYHATNNNTPNDQVVLGVGPDDRAHSDQSQNFESINDEVSVAGELNASGEQDASTIGHQKNKLHSKVSNDDNELSSNSIAETNDETAISKSNDSKGLTNIGFNILGTDDIGTFKSEKRISTSPSSGDLTGNTSQGNEAPMNLQSSVIGLQNSSRLKLASLDFLSSSLEDSKGVEGEFISSFALPKLNDCYDFSLRSWLWTVDVYAGFNYAAKNMKLKNNSGAAENYIDHRKSTEDYLEAFDAGFAFNAIHRKGLMLSAGLNYSQIDEKFNYFQVKSETRFDSVVVRIEIDSSGHADTIKDWRPVTVQTASEILTYNYYRMLDIPLAVGYQFHKGKWTFEFQGGVMLNLLLKKQGEILDTSANVVEFTDNDVVFKDRIGLSVFGSFKAIYPLTDRIGVYAEPNARVNLSSITVDGYPLEQRYNQFGLRLGARFIF